MTTETSSKNTKRVPLIHSLQFLKKYALKSGLDLWKLKENKSYVKKSIYKKIKSKLKELGFKKIN